MHVTAHKPAHNTARHRARHSEMLKVSVLVYEELHIKINSDSGLHY